MVFNLNYGPFGNGTFHGAQKICLQEFVMANHAGCPAFLPYADLIAADHGLPKPQSDAELEEVWRRFSNMQSVQLKGTCVKLMRWFSFFEAWKAFKPDFWSKKLLLHIYMNEKKDADLDAEQARCREKEAGKKSAESAEKELAELKKHYGAFFAAYTMLDESTQWQALAMEAAVQPIWKHQTARLQNTWQKDKEGPAEPRSPNGNMRYEAHMASGGWKDEIEDIILQNFKNSDVLQSLQLDLGRNPDRLAEFFDFVLWCCRTRAASLVQHASPPRVFAALLEPGADREALVTDLQQQWRWLLGMEEMLAAGAADVRASPLERCHWRLSTVCRYIFALLEAGEAPHLVTSVSSQAQAKLE